MERYPGLMGIVNQKIVFYLSLPIIITQIILPENVWHKRLKNKENTMAPKLLEQKRTCLFVFNAACVCVCFLYE